MSRPNAAAMSLGINLTVRFSISFLLAYEASVPGAARQNLRDSTARPLRTLSSAATCPPMQVMRLRGRCTRNTSCDAMDLPTMLDLRKADAMGDVIDDLAERVQAVETRMDQVPTSIDSRFDGVNAAIVEGRHV